MFSFVRVAALFAGLPTLLIPQALQWSAPTPLREASGYINGYFASSSNGSKIVIWGQDNGSPATGGDVLARISQSGSEWSPVMLVSDGSGYLQAPVAVAIADDGTAIASWRQVVEQPVYESQIVVRKFVPDTGWGPIQLLSTRATEPILALAPDGRAHIIYWENQSVVARTLAPGESAWSTPVNLGNSNSGPTNLVVGRDFAYEAFITIASDSGESHGVVSLASYTRDGWRPAGWISDPAVSAAAPQLTGNNGHVVVSWITYDSPFQNTQWVQRLTDSRERFPLPTIGNDFFLGYPGRGSGSSCNIVLGADGTVLATCSAKGELVPNCQDASRSGPVPAFYYHLEMFRRPVGGDWSSAEVISDLGKRVDGAPDVLASSLGDVVVLWNSEVPCQSSIGQVSRLWRSSQSDWEPEVATSFLQGRSLTVDNYGTFHALWAKTDVNYDRSPAVLSALGTADLLTRLPPYADLDGSGAVDCADLTIVRESIGKKVGEPGYDSRADANQDGVVDVRDLAFVASQLPPGSECH